MAEYATLTILAHAELLPGHVQEIKFRPGQPGSIGVETTMTGPKHSETGLLAQATLYRPGTDEPIATSTADVSDSVLGSDDLVGLGYEATATDLAMAGDWTYRVSNEADTTRTFSTTVGYPSDYLLQTASFDIGLLNLLVSEAMSAAALHVHLETGPDALSRVSWSPALALRLGQTESTFPVPDQTVRKYEFDWVFHITKLDSGPRLPTAVVGAPGVLSIMIPFDAAAAVAEVDRPNFSIGVTFDFFSLQLNIYFDGRIEPICQTKATLRVQSHDVSDDVKSGFEKALQNRVSNDSQLAPDQVRKYLEGFFVGLMRLSYEDASGVYTAHIYRYQVDGQRLIVTYYVVHSKKVHVRPIDGGLVTPTDGGA